MGFTPTFGISDSKINIPLAFFGFSLELPNGTSTIQLWNNIKNQMIAERQINAHTPLAKIISPDENQVIHRGENLTVSWKSSDADNDALTFLLAYSHDGKSWFPVGKNEYVLNTNDLPTGESYLKIIVTDSTNTAESNIVRFTIS